MRSDILVSLRMIMATGGAAEFYRALDNSLRRLSAEATTPIATAAEFAETHRGVELLWRLDGTGYSDDGLKTLFKAAKGASGRCVSIGEKSVVAATFDLLQLQCWCMLVADGATLPPEEAKDLEDMAFFCAMQLARLRNDEECSLRYRRLKAEAQRDAALVRAEAELAWEVDGDGCLFVTQNFRSAGDLARRISGKHLSQISVGAEDLQSKVHRGESFSSRRALLNGDSKAFFLTCVSPKASRAFGLASSQCGASEDKLVLDARIIDKVLDARKREEHQRHETEAVLMGMRILLSDNSYQDRLKRLAVHITQVMRCLEPRLIRVRPGDLPRLIMPSGPQPNLGALEAILLSIGGFAILPASSAEAASITQILKIGSGDVVIVPLETQTERFYLISCARGQIDVSDRSIVERMSLVLHQALLMQADQDRLVHAGKLSVLGQMSTSIAHELRQPLNTISIAAQNIDLMAEGGNIDAGSLRERAARILAQIDRACRVMDRMRRFGRKAEGEYKAINLADLVDSVASLMHEPLRNSGIELEMAVPDYIGVLADSLEIEQVLVNLIQNAVDAMKIGPEDRRIVLRAGIDPADEGMVRLSVEDTGGGFPPEVLKHALDAFFTTKPEGEGTGLGLSISHTIVREHGGRLFLGNSDLGGQVTLVLRRANGATEATKSGPRLAWGH